MMRIVPTLAAGAVVCVLGTVAASASPALPLSGIVLGDTEWHPSTRHWDHHFDANQRSRHDLHVIEAEEQFGGPVLRSRPYARQRTRYGAGRGLPY